jgi:hypothetical protein
MKRICKSLVYKGLVYKGLVYKSLAIVAVVALGGRVLTGPANAAPPTVTPSPGYDARLQEQRSARGNAAPVTYEPLVPAAKPASARVRRAHHHAR